jgi:hypothetical protein
MKIAYAIPSRGRPYELTAVVVSAWTLRCKAHDIRFLVALDEDDTPSQDALRRLAAESDIPVQWDCRPRPMSLGSKWNRLIPEWSEAEIVSMMSDRVFVTTLNWDDILAKAAATYPNRILWWSCPINPHNTFPAIPMSFLRACDNRPFPEIFPFWWTDTWLNELDHMVFMNPTLKLPCQLIFNPNHRSTQLRDLAFWGRVFEATRAKRIRKAVEIAHRLGRTGITEDVIRGDPALMDWCRRQDQHLQKNASEFERLMSDPAPPSESYLQAKAEAERLLAALAS